MNYSWTEFIKVREVNNGCVTLSMLMTHAAESERENVRKQNWFLNDLLLKLDSGWVELLIDFIVH